MFRGLGTKLDSFVLPAWPRAWHGSEEPVDLGSEQGRYCPLGAVLETGEGMLDWHPQGGGKKGLPASRRQRPGTWRTEQQLSTENCPLSHAPFVYVKTYS